MNEELDVTAAGKQGARLGALSHFPNNAVVAGEVLRVLRDICRGNRKTHGKTYNPEAQCVAVIDSILDRATGWHGPAQLRDAHDDLFPNYPEID
jgi:hypothetical protein